MLKDLLQIASRNSAYKKNIDLIGTGVRAVNGGLTSVLEGLDDSLKLFSPTAIISYSELLTMKARVLDILGRINEGNQVRSLAFLRRGIDLINGNKPEGAN